MKASVREERTIGFVHEPVRMLFGDVGDVWVAGAVDSVHPDAGFHPGGPDGLDGVLPAAGEFPLVPVQPVFGTAAVALLIGVIELHVVVSEVGKMLFDKQLQHRVERFLREASTVRPPCAVACE